MDIKQSHYQDSFNINVLLKVHIMWSKVIVTTTFNAMKLLDVALLLLISKRLIPFVAVLMFPFKVGQKRVLVMFGQKATYGARARN